MTRLIKRKRSLFFRFPLHLGLITGLVLIISALLYNHIFTGYIRKVFRSESNSIADALTPVLTRALPDKQPIHNEIAFSKNSLLVSIQVHSMDGKLLFSAGSFRHSFAKFTLRREVRISSLGVGVATFAFRHDLHERRIITCRIFLLFFCLFLFLSIMITAHYLLLRQIRRPLRLMMRATEMIARGDFSPKMHFAIRDELALLGADIKAMGYSLKRSFREIEEKKSAISRYSEGLEQMVAERTGELDAVNSTLEERNRQFIRELEMARSVQLGMIPAPDSVIQHRNLEVSVHYDSMFKLGGDLLDIVRMGHSSYAFLIADVSGHGVPSSLITAMAKVSFMTNCHWGVPPGEICASMNREICRLIGEQRYFISMFLGIIDMETGLFSYSNGGHHPTVLIGTDGALQLLEIEGKLVGVWEDAEFASGTRTLNAGDTLLMYTDGITEARNPGGDMYGKERLFRICRENASRNTESLLQEVIREVNMFAAGRDADDDRALMAIRFNGIEKLSHKGIS